VRADEAERLIAEALTKSEVSPELKEIATESELVGLRRSRPIYAHKQRALKSRTEVRRYSTLVDLISFVVRVLRSAFRRDVKG
jgi:hypothetical protein